jgi:mRNA-degrading endonuclease RelE of RelBE toxin-antitoxin system
MRAALIALATTTASGGRGGKTLKTIRGTEGDFHRARVGDWRIMYDVLPDDKVLLVLGIVNRRDLERWLRNR